MDREDAEHESQPLRLEWMQRELYWVERRVLQQAFQQPIVRDQDARDGNASRQMRAGESEHEADGDTRCGPVPRAETLPLEQIGRERHDRQQQTSGREHVHR